MQDATCHVDSKSQNLVLTNINQNDLTLLNITHGPVATLTNFPSLLTSYIRLAGRSDGSSSGASSCTIQVVTVLTG